MILNPSGIVLALLVLLPGATRAEQLRLAVGQRGNWDTGIAELGERAGIFKRHGLELEILYTAGGGETQQAVLSRSVDIGVAAGTLGVLGAAAKGAPVRIIGAQTTGAADLFWYVPAASPIRTPADLAGRSVAYSTTGSSTDTVARLAEAQYGIAFQHVATGGLPGTYTQTMSGQVDVGWSAAPFALEALNADTIRAIIRGGDIAAVRDQSIRVTITHAAVLAARKPALIRFMQAYRETLDTMYSDPEALRSYVAFSGTSLAVAQSMRDQFFPKAALDPRHIGGLDAMMADGVRLKFMAAPLTPTQLKTIIAIDEVMP